MKHVGQSTLEFRFVLSNITTRRHTPPPFPPWKATWLLHQKLTMKVYGFWSPSCALCPRLCRMPASWMWCKEVMSATTLGLCRCASPKPYERAVDATTIAMVVIGVIQKLNMAYRKRMPKKKSTHPGQRGSRQCYFSFLIHFPPLERMV